MKEMTKYSRVAAYLEKLFDMLNDRGIEHGYRYIDRSCIPHSKAYKSHIDRIRRKAL